MTSTPETPSVLALSRQNLPQLRREGGDDRDHPRQLLLDQGPGRAGARGLAADVEDVGAVREQLPAVAGSLFSSYAGPYTLTTMSGPSAAWVGTDIGNVGLAGTHTIFTGKYDFPVTVVAPRAAGRPRRGAAGTCCWHMVR